MSRVSVLCLLTLDDFFFFGPLRISGVLAFSSVELSRCHFGSALASLIRADRFFLCLMPGFCRFLR